MNHLTDELSQSLEIIQENLRKVAADHSEKLWFQKGKFSLSESIRGDKSVELLSKDIVDFLINYLNAQLGTFYTTENDISTLRYSYGISEKVNSIIPNGHGLLGQAAVEKKIRLYKNVPESFFKISSSTGSQKPDSLIVVPAISGDKTVAVFELAKLGEFSASELLFIEEVREYIAISINTGLGKLKMEQLFDDLKEHQRELTQQISALNNAAIVSETDAEGNITFVNDMFCHISEYSREELIGQNHRLLKSGKQPQGLFIGMWKAISMGNIWQGEIINKKKGGTYYWVDTTIVPFKNSDGAIYKYVSIRFDITTKKELELELEEKLNERTQMLDQLSDQNTQLEDFNNIISHNLRGPLSNLLILSSMIEDTADLEKKLGYIDKIKLVTNSLKETFEELVEATQIRMDKDVEKQELSFHDCLQKNINALEGEIVKSGAKITADFKRADSIRYPKKYLDSILYNLCSNAIKYKAHDRLPNIQITTYSKDKWIYLEVSDNGLGIDLKKNGSNLFKLRKVFHDHPDAKGFGLFITKTQIDSEGGQISAESTPGVGSKFIIKLAKQTW